MKNPKLQRKASFLLVVFSTMLLMSWMHVHDMSNLFIDCADCAHHVNHSHMSVPTVSLDSCLLCQIVHTPYESGTILKISTPIAPEQHNAAQLVTDAVSVAPVPTPALRAPPVCIV